MSRQALPCWLRLSKRGSRLTWCWNSLRSIALGVAVGITLSGLLWATIRVSAQTIPPLPTPPVAEPPASAAQADLVLTATVGLVPGVCAISDTVQARANQTVYYCFTLHNRGGIDLLTHSVRSPLRELTSTLTWPITANRAISTVIGGLVFTDATNVDFRNEPITWTARNAGASVVITATDRVTVDIVGPAVSVLKTVGQNRETCPTATTLRIQTGGSAYYCLTLHNVGDTALVTHTVSDPPLGINGTFALNLAPEATLVITPGRLNTLGVAGTLGHTSLSAAFTNTVNVTSRTATNLEARDTATTTLDVGTTTVQFSKTVSLDSEACAGKASIVAPPGSQLYYCVVIRNTGVTTLTHHSLVEANLSIDLQFDYPLPPGEVLRITNNWLAEHNQPVVFGPFEFSARFPQAVNNRMNYVGSILDDNGNPILDDNDQPIRVAVDALTTATFLPTPTPTATDTPDPTNTPIPSWTPTPTISPTPFPTPMPTFTPVTPTPTPTHSYMISLLETPTPSQPLLPPTPVVDPAFFAVTLTAQAATATAAALSFVSPLNPPFSPLETPTLDPAFFSPPFGAQPGLPSPLDTPTPTFENAGLPTSALPPATSPLVIVVTATDTPTLQAGALPPGQRPVVPPTPTPTPDYVMFAATMLDSLLLTAGWIWFLAGSLIFFVSAGIVAGLFFRQQEVRRFDLVEGELEDGTVVAVPNPPTPERGRSPSSNDDWPDSLP